MTLEELKRLHEYIYVFDMEIDYKRQRRAGITEDEAWEIIGLAESFIYEYLDAEIERQSVGDGEIQRAISLMEWCKVDVWKNHPIASEEEIANAVSRYDLAIDALGAYQKQEPYADRNKAETCGLCGDTTLKGRYGLIASLQAVAEDQRNFCPSCGRAIDSHRTAREVNHETTEKGTTNG